MIVLRRLKRRLKKLSSTTRKPPFCNLALRADAATIAGAMDAVVLTAAKRAAMGAVPMVRRADQADRRAPLRAVATMIADRADLRAALVDRMPVAEHRKVQREAVMDWPISSASCKRPSMRCVAFAAAEIADVGRADPDSDLEVNSDVADSPAARAASDLAAPRISVAETTVADLIVVLAIADAAMPVATTDLRLADRVAVLDRAAIAPASVADRMVLQADLAGRVVVLVPADLAADRMVQVVDRAAVVRMVVVLMDLARAPNVRAPNMIRKIGI